MHDAGAVVDDIDVECLDGADEITIDRLDEDSRVGSERLGAEITRLADVGDPLRRRGRRWCRRRRWSARYQTEEERDGLERTSHASVPTYRRSIGPTSPAARADHSHHFTPRSCSEMHLRALSTARTCGNSEPEVVLPRLRPRVRSELSPLRLHGRTIGSHSSTTCLIQSDPWPSGSALDPLASARSCRA